MITHCQSDDNGTHNETLKSLILKKKKLSKARNIISEEDINNSNRSAIGIL